MSAIEAPLLLWSCQGCCMVVVLTAACSLPSDRWVYLLWCPLQAGELACARSVLASSVSLDGLLVLRQVRGNHPGSTTELQSLRDLDGHVHGIRAATARARPRHLASMHVPIHAPTRPLTRTRLAGCNVVDAEGRANRCLGALARPWRAADRLVVPPLRCQRLRRR